MEKSIRILVANRPRLMRELLLATLASDSTKRQPDELGIRGIPGGMDSPGNLPSKDALNDNPASSERTDPRSGPPAGTDMQPVRSGRMTRERGELSPTEHQFEPVVMIRRPNPYSDVPSLYDMYVQASPRENQLERFGTQVFKNGTRDAEAIPMDLPVGPEYVVGPGDAW